MAGIQVNKLTNCNIYVDGTNFAGRAEEVGLPTVKQKMSDHKALGTIGEVEFWSGGIEKMEMRIKWSSFYRDAFLKGADPTQARKIMVRGSLKTFAGGSITSETPYVCYATGVFKEIPLGDFKQLDNAEFTSNVSLYYVKLESDGENLLEIDPTANIYKVGGVDILQKFRLNLGL